MNVSRGRSLEPTYVRIEIPRELLENATSTEEIDTFVERERINRGLTHVSFSLPKRLAPNHSNPLVKDTGLGGDITAAGLLGVAATTSRVSQEDFCSENGTTPCGTAPTSRRKILKRIAQGTAAVALAFGVGGTWLKQEASAVTCTACYSDCSFNEFVGMYQKTCYYYRNGCAIYCGCLTVQRPVNCSNAVCPGPQNC